MMNHKEFLELIEAYNNGLNQLLGLRLGIKLEAGENNDTKENLYLRLSQIAESLGYFDENNNHAEVINYIINELQKTQIYKERIYTVPECLINFNCSSCSSGSLEECEAYWYDIEIVPLIEEWLEQMGWPTKFADCNGEIKAKLLKPKHHIGWTRTEILNDGYVITGKFNYWKED